MRVKNNRSKAFRQGDAVFGSPEKTNVVAIESRGMWLKADSRNWTVALPVADAPVTPGTYLAEIESKDGRILQAIISLTKWFQPTTKMFDGQEYVLYRKGAYRIDWETQKAKQWSGETNVQKRAWASKAVQTRALKNRTA